MARLRSLSKLSTHRRRQLAACLIAAAFASPLATLAATDNWTNSAGGTFNVGTNWSSNPTVPGSGDIANFNLASTYTVTFTNSPTNSAVTVRQGSVTWNANGTAQTYTASSSSAVLGGALTLGSSGALLTVQTAVLTVEGPNASLTTKSSSSLITGNIDLAGDNQANGNGTITDSSTITQLNASTLFIGSASQGVGILNVTTGGTFTTATGLTTISATGHLNINGNGQFNLNGNLTVAGGTVNQTGGALFWNTAGTTLTIQSGGTVNLISENATPTNGVINISGAGSQLNDTGVSADLFIDNGGQLSATSGAKVTSPFFDVAYIGNGTATFDGANTSLTATNSDNTIGVSGTGVLTFSNNASGTTGGFIIGQNAGSSGTLDVKSNAILTSGSIAVASSATTAVGTINVDSGGALSMTAGSTLTIGATGGSLATVTIAGGTLSTGTGLTTINPTGHFYLNTGTFNLNGDLTVTTGFLLQQTTATFNWAANHNMTIQSAGKVTLAGGYATPTNAAITVSGTGSQLNDTGSADLAINNGATLSATAGALVHSDGYFDIASAGNGTVTIDGAGTSLTITNTNAQNFLGTTGTGSLTFSNSASGSSGGFSIGEGNGSRGTLNVQSNATLTSGTITLALSATSATGAINVTGGTLTQSGAATVTIGSTSGSSGNVTIGTAGVYNTGTGLTTVNATGIINLTAGTFNLNSDITLAGGSLTQTGGTFTWPASHTMTIQTGGSVNLLNTYTTPANAVINISGANSKFSDTGPVVARLTIDNGTIVSVTSGGLLHSDQFLNIASFSNATVTIDGAGSSLTSGNAQSILGNFGTGTLTFSTMATGNIGFLQVGSQNGSSGTLNVQTTASLFIGTLNIAPNATTAIGAVNVNQGLLSMNPGATLTVGASSLSSATITIGAAGTLSTGTGAVTINPTGTINNTAGTFTLNGRLTNSGSFTSSSALNANANITNSGTFTQSGPQTWSVGTTFTNTGGHALFLSNAKLFGLTITGGTVDTTFSKLIIEPANKGTTLSALETDLYTAHSLTSSTLPAHTALAVIDNATLPIPFTTFGGLPADSGSILIAPELLGDANVDGTVNLTDLNIVLARLGTTDPNWTHGNFDGQPTIDLTDLDAVLNNLGVSFANFSSVLAAESLLATPAPTPEPASLITLAIGFSLLLKRTNPRRSK